MTLIICPYGKVLSCELRKCERNEHFLDIYKNYMIIH